MWNIRIIKKKCFISIVGVSKTFSYQLPYTEFEVIRNSYYYRGSICETTRPNFPRFFKHMRNTFLFAFGSHQNIIASPTVDDHSMLFLKRMPPSNIEYQIWQGMNQINIHYMLSFSHAVIVVVDSLIGSQRAFIWRPHYNAVLERLVGMNSEKKKNRIIQGPLDWTVILRGRPLTGFRLAVIVRSLQASNEHANEVIWINSIYSYTYMYPKAGESHPTNPIISNHCLNM